MKVGLDHQRFGIDQKLLKIYSNVFKCSNFDCNNHFAMNYPNHEECLVPRDFFGYYQPPKKILVIGLNPGKILESEIREYNKIHQSPGRITQEEAEEMVFKHLELSEEVFQKGVYLQDNQLRYSFHKDFPEAVSKVLNIKKYEIFDYIYYTTMVKCQTQRSIMKLKLSDKKYLIKNCYNNHLKHEIRALKPDLILTYGSLVYESLPWRNLIPIRVFNLPRIWAEASSHQRKLWRDQLDVMQNNISPIVNEIKEKLRNLNQDIIEIETY